MRGEEAYGKALADEQESYEAVTLDREPRSPKSKLAERVVVDAAGISVKAGAHTGEVSGSVHKRLGSQRCIPMDAREVSRDHSSPQRSWAKDGPKTETLQPNAMIDELLPPEPDEDLRWGTGRMVAVPPAVHPLATVETSPYPLQEVGAARAQPRTRT